MKRLLSFSIAFLLHTTSFSATIEKDKILHFGASAAISSSTYILSKYFGASTKKSILVSLAVTVSAGIAKEVSDPVFDGEDLAVDCIGAVVPLLILSF